VFYEMLELSTLTVKYAMDREQAGARWPVQRENNRVLGNNG
jgi:hypothetical protein